MSTAVKAGRPAYSPRTLNIVTASIMVVFHVLAVAAFLLASSSIGKGVVQVDGGGNLTPIHGGSGSESPTDIEAQAGAVERGDAD